MMGIGHGFGMYGFGGGSFMMILIFLLIGYLIYLGIRQNRNNEHSNQSATSSNALDIAKSRLAKGEITIEEFEQIKKSIL